MGHTILVIDSVPAQCDSLCTALREKFSYQVVALAGGRETVNYVMTDQSPKPDVILFDVPAVAEGAKAIANLKIMTSRAPIIAMVKFGDYTTANAMIDAGAQDFLAKPVPVERLRLTLRNILLLCDARREAEWLRHNSSPAAPGDRGTHPAGASPYSLMGGDGHIRRMEELEAEAIRFAMQYYNGRMTEVARRLGIGRSTLYRKLGEINVRQEEAA